jgi:hypothetical protein
MRSRETDTGEQTADRTCRIALAQGRWLCVLAEPDAPELYAVMEANRARLSRWMPWAADQTLTDTLAFVRRTREQLRAAVENARSRAIPERLGFTHDGVLRAAERIGDRRVGQVVYAMVRG